MIVIPIMPSFLLIRIHKNCLIFRTFSNCSIICSFYSTSCIISHWLSVRNSCSCRAMHMNNCRNLVSKSVVIYKRIAVINRHNILPLYIVSPSNSYWDVFRCYDSRTRVRINTAFVSLSTICINCSLIEHRIR
jgi:hypothetical protein